VVWGNRNKFEQLLINLIINAADAMPEGGGLTIQTSADTFGKGVEVLVSDTGTGMPKEILDKIFDPFFTTKEPGKGSGLGLSICLRIVESMSGRIEVESEVGLGTTFHIFLPKADLAIQENVEQ
jgi:signal transduction histidine kinase